MLKGRQSGGVHRGHAWVFRAESYDTMLAWYEDIKNLTEKTGEERTAFIRAHARSVSAGSNKALSISDDGAMDEDEADQVPYSATASQIGQPPAVGEARAERPNPGGRFPSAIATNRNSQVEVPPSSPSSSEDHDIIAKSEPFPALTSPGEVSSFQAQEDYGTAAKIGTPRQTETDPLDTYTPIPQRHEYNGLPVTQGPLPVTLPGSEYYTSPVYAEGVSSDGPGSVSYGASPSQPAQSESSSKPSFPQPTRHDSKYGDWMAPAAGAGGLAFGAGSVAAYKHHQEQEKEKEKEREAKRQIESEQALPIEPTTANPNQIASTLQQEPQQIETEPSIYPTTTSTQPLPPNVAWAPGSSGSVVEPDQIISRDETPTEVNPNNNPADTFSTQGLSPVTEQPSPDPTRDPAAPIKALANRPPLTSHDSVTTISDLHVPGEYPRNKGGLYD